MRMEAKGNKTVVGTDINEVKKQNRQSGLTYNEAKLALAKQKGFIGDDKK